MRKVTKNLIEIQQGMKKENERMPIYKTFHYTKSRRFLGKFLRKCTKEDSKSVAA